MMYNHKNNGCTVNGLLRYCAWYAHRHFCNHIWNNVVPPKCKKKISHRWQPVKNLCRKSCNACGKGISLFRRYVKNCISFMNGVSTFQ